MNLANLIVGAATLKEWFDEDYKGVPPGIAEHRASICAVCPLNRDEKWSERFAGYFETLLAIRRIMKERGMVTVHDHKLGVCDACQCPMKIKIWTPLHIINNHIPAQTRDKLHEKCWMK